MDLRQRIDAFVALGKNLDKILGEKKLQTDNYAELGNFLAVSQSNEWFTENNILFALRSIAENLTESKINNWLEKYPQLAGNKKIKRVGVVTAGNIPLVGFHDLLCVLLSGNELVIKASSKDNKLMKLIVDLLIELNIDFNKLIHFETERLKNFDAIIATGSDNTAKYFEYYFGKYPNIIRKNRNSIAILNGNETDEELELLADDMLMYFGLGCRNVSKLFLPKGFDYQRIFKSVQAYHHLTDHNKYANNFLYNKSIYLMNNVVFWENGFIMMKEDSGLASPISVIFFEYYSSINDIKQRIELDKDRIQCIVAKDGLIDDSVNYGEAQKPYLWDYADNVDTMKFLLSLKN